MPTQPQAAQAPSSPPIPPVPSAPGAATGAQTVTTVRIAPGASPEETQRAIQNAIQATENAVQATGNAATAVAPPQLVEVSPDIPPEVVPIIGIIFGSVAFMVVGFPVVRGIMRMLERRQDRNLVHGPAVAQQLAQLQQSVDALAIEVERISEAQRFQSKLMAERGQAALGEGSGAPRA
jgi:hypothetical protein